VRVCRHRPLTKSGQYLSMMDKDKASYRLAANSGAGDESRIATQQEELDWLTKERDALLKK
jgi:hypothetical protein